MPIYGGSYSLHHGQTLATASFNSTAFGSFTVEILNIDTEKMGEREEIEVTSQSTLPNSTGMGNRAWLPSAYQDPGIIKMLIHYDASQAIMITNWAMAASGTAGAVNSASSNIGSMTVYMGPASTAQGSFSVGIAWLKNFNIRGPMDGKTVQAEITIRCTGILDGTTSTGAVIQGLSA